MPADAIPDRTALLSDAPPTSARTCVVSPSPEELPAVVVLVDSAGLHRDVAELVTAQDTGYVLLSMVHDAGGVNIRRSVIEHRTRPMVADSVQRLVFQHRRETEGALGVRLRVDLHPEVAMRVGRQELCPPVPLDPEMESAMFFFRTSEPRFRGGQRLRTVWVRVFVNSSGTVVASRVERGSVEGVDMERSIFDFVRRYAFRPATEDGLPVPGNLLIPVRVPGR